MSEFIKNIQEFFKKFKIRVALIGIAMEVVLFLISMFIGKDMAQQINTVMVGVIAITVAVIGGHTATDVAYQIKQGRDSFKNSVDNLKKTIDATKEALK